MARNSGRKNGSQRGRSRAGASRSQGSLALAPLPDASGTTRRLMGMAVLKAQFDVNAQSYMDNFVPYAVGCLEAMPQRAVSAAAVREQLNAEFGLDIPEHAVTSVLKRATTQGIVKRSNNLYELTNRNQAGPPMSRNRDDLLRKHNALVDKLVTFTEERFSRVITFEEAESALLDHMDEQGVPLALRFMQCPDPRELRIVEDPTIEHVVLEFIEYVSQSEPVLFEYLEAVFQGSMLTTALFLPDPGAVKQRFRDTTVYFDTVLLLRVLGLAGPELGEPALELVASLKRNGAKLACFQETVEELRGVLSAAGHELRQGGRKRPTGPTDVVGHCVNVGIRSSDLRLIIDLLEEKLAEHGVATVRRPSVDINLSIDEQGLGDELAAAAKYPRPEALRHDVEVVAAVHHIRKGWRPKRVEESRAVLVTTNGALVGVARRHFRHGGEFTWPLVLMDTDLATILWLKEPMAAPDFPRKRIIADCYAALRPTPELWVRYLDEVDQLSKSEFSDEEFAILRYSVAAQQALTVRSEGNADAVTGDMVTQVLADAKAALVAPERRRIEAVTEQYEEAEAGRAAAEAAVDAAAQKSEQEEAEKAGLESELRSTKAALTAIQQRDRARARRRAKNRARREANAVFALGIVIVVGGALVALFGGSVPSGLRIVAGVVAVLAAVFGVASMVSGWHLLQGKGRFQRWRTAKLEARYLAEVDALDAEESGPAV